MCVIVIRIKGSEARITLGVTVNLHQTYGNYATDMKRKDGYLSLQGPFHST